MTATGPPTTATLTHTASGGDYANGNSNTLPVTVTDDDTAVTVQFGADAYTVSEGSTATITVILNADPERTVVIPLVATGQVGATTDDYSGVPEDLTINAGETSKTFEFMATADDTSDTGESVKISFGASLPSRVTEGTPNEATVTIKQVSTQFDLDCAGTAVVWCADVGFSDQTAENWGWAYLRYGEGLDPEASLSDDDFQFRAVDYTVLSMELRPGTHPVMPNGWSRWQQGYSSFRIVINWGPSSLWDPSEEHYRDWVLHVDGLELPFKDAFVFGDDFTWVGRSSSRSSTTGSIDGDQDRHQGGGGGRSGHQSAAAMGADAGGCIARRTQPAPDKLGQAGLVHSRTARSNQIYRPVEAGVGKLER